MDKAATHTLADFYGIRQAGWECVSYSDFKRCPEKHVQRLERRFGDPMFIKPAGTGSSVGVSKVRDRAALAEAIAFAGGYDDKVIAEEFIDGREIEVAVLGNREPVASVCGEIIPGAEFYTYAAKYLDDTSSLKIPAPIDEKTSETVRETAIKAYKMAGCLGLARVDFFLSRKTGAVVFNEINTMPGFTSISMYPKLFEASGIPYSSLIDRLIELALEEHKNA
jgi:D-alanine-D-alanine ligase